MQNQNTSSILASGQPKNRGACCASCSKNIYMSFCCFQPALSFCRYNIFQKHRTLKTTRSTLSSLSHQSCFKTPRKSSYCSNAFTGYGSIYHYPQPCPGQWPFHPPQAVDTSPTPLGHLPCKVAGKWKDWMWAYGGAGEGICGNWDMQLGNQHFLRQLRK